MALTKITSEQAAKELEACITQHVPDGYDQVEPGHTGPLRREALTLLRILTERATSKNLWR